MECVMTDTPIGHTVSERWSLRGSLRQGLARLAQADRDRRAVRDLSRLDDRLLRDIGLTRPQAEDEIRRLLWREPAAEAFRRAP
jgi:uncharacterized protein YjiS (DUF1127 family)